MTKAQLVGLLIIVSVLGTSVAIGISSTANSAAKAQAKDKPESPSVTVVIDGWEVKADRYPVAAQTQTGAVYWWTLIDGKEIRFTGPWHTLPR